MKFMGTTRLFLSVCLLYDGTLSKHTHGSQQNQPNLTEISAGFLELLELESEPEYVDSRATPDYMWSFYEAFASANPGHYDRRSGNTPFVVSAIPAEKFMHNGNRLSATFHLDPEENSPNFVHTELVVPSQYLRGSHVLSRPCIWREAQCLDMSHQRRHFTQNAVASWDIFRITDFFSYWRQNADNYILNLTINLRSGNRVSPFGWKQYDPDVVLLVLYTADPEVMLLQAKQTTSTRNMPKSTVSDEQDAGMTNRLSRSKREQSLCALTSWTLTFESLGWSLFAGGWIIAPDFVEANYCSGECPDPLNVEGIQHTNHAYLRSVYRSEQEMQDVPGGCCVPLQLRAIDLLYKKNNQTLLRRLEEMKAEECACL